MEKMQKDAFKLKYNTDTKELIIVKAKDEMTKNHRQMENLISSCPVQLFCTYMAHLHPENNYMWQYPVEEINPKCPDNWYTKKHLGKNPLATFMSYLSRDTGLYKIYTKHSIRATEITVLTNLNFSNADIMAVSGHKSIQSLTVY